MQALFLFVLGLAVAGEVGLAPTTGPRQLALQLRVVALRVAGLVPTRGPRLLVLQGWVLGQFAGDLVPTRGPRSLAGGWRGLVPQVCPRLVQVVAAGASARAAAAAAVVGVVAAASLRQSR